MDRLEHVHNRIDFYRHSPKPHTFKISGSLFQFLLGNSFFAISITYSGLESATRV